MVSDSMPHYAHLLVLELKRLLSVVVVHVLTAAVVWCRRLVAVVLGFCCLLVWVFWFVAMLALVVSSVLLLSWVVFAAVVLFVMLLLFLFERAWSSSGFASLRNDQA